ncbi:MAG: DUF4296 domain-containing protein [Bacteroidales bacterium]|nr:MAG: DUF4296 domain-containing protein [Bacteroidales bacterium]
MVPLLVDMHIADATGLSYLPDQKQLRVDSAALYGWIFDKHEVTRMQFDSTMAFYTKHPDRLSKVYEKVIAGLSKLESEIKEAEKDEALKKKITLWEDTKNYMLPNDGSTNRLSFSVPVSELGEYTVTASIKVFRDDESLAPRINAFFWYDNQTEQGYRDYFKSAPIKKNEILNTYTITKQLRNENVTHIKGFIYNHSNQDTLFLKHAFISGIKIIYENF